MSAKIFNVCLLYVMRPKEMLFDTAVAKSISGGESEKGLCVYKQRSTFSRSPLNLDYEMNKQNLCSPCCWL